MTPQELAALPVGTRVRLLIEDMVSLGDGEVERLGKSYEFGTVVLQSSIVHVTWDSGPASLIDTKSKVWEPFIADMEGACDEQL
jgi:hypothetical protein